MHKFIVSVGIMMAGMQVQAQLQPPTQAPAGYRFPTKSEKLGHFLGAKDSIRNYRVITDADEDNRLDEAWILPKVNPTPEEQAAVFIFFKKKDGTFQPVKLLGTPKSAQELSIVGLGWVQPVPVCETADSCSDSLYHSQVASIIEVSTLDTRKEYYWHPRLKRFMVARPATMS